MIDKNKLLEHIDQLLGFTKARDTNQGVKVCEGAFKKIEMSISQDEVDDYFVKLKHALAGIEAHGHFTKEEFEVVKEIRAMRQGQILFMSEK